MLFTFRKGDWVRVTSAAVNVVRLGQDITKSYIRNGTTIVPLYLSGQEIHVEDTGDNKNEKNEKKKRKKKKKGETERTELNL